MAIVSSVDDQVTPSTEAVNCTDSPKISFVLPSAAVMVIFSCLAELCCVLDSPPPSPPPPQAARPKLTKSAKAATGRRKLFLFIMFKNSFLRTLWQPKKLWLRFIYKFSIRYYYNPFITCEAFKNNFYFCFVIR